MQTSCSACANCNPLVLPDHLEVESYRDSSSPESRIRTHSSSASTRLTATRCSMPTCSTRSNRCVKSPRLGYANQRGAASRQPRPRAAPHVHAEAKRCRGVQFQTVCLTGSLRGHPDRRGNTRLVQPAASPRLLLVSLICGSSGPPCMLGDLRIDLCQKREHQAIERLWVFKHQQMVHRRHLYKTGIWPEPMSLRSPIFEVYI